MRNGLRLRAADGLWAIGDLTGVGAFTHLAVHQARIAAADILGEQHAPADYTALPRVTFTDPEVGSVGLTESAARAAGFAVATGVAHVGVCPGLDSRAGQRWGDQACGRRRHRCAGRCHRRRAAWR